MIRLVSRTAIAANSKATPTPMITQIRRLTCSARMGKVSWAPSDLAVGGGELEPDVVDAALVGRGVEQHGLLAGRASWTGSPPVIVRPRSACARTVTVTGTSSSLLTMAENRPELLARVTDWGAARERWRSGWW